VRLTLLRTAQVRRRIELEPLLRDLVVGEVGVVGGRKAAAMKRGCFEGRAYM
jgi:hypothetical protein